MLKYMSVCIDTVRLTHIASLLSSVVSAVLSWLPSFLSLRFEAGGRPDHKVKSLHSVAMKLWLQRKFTKR